jgi:hypothetical protein
VGFHRVVDGRGLFRRLPDLRHGLPPPLLIIDLVHGLFLPI